MMKEGIPVPVIREIMCLKQLNHRNITKLFDIVLNDPKYNKKDIISAVTVIPYNSKKESESTQWNLHLVQEFVPNELFAVMRNLKVMHFESNGWSTAEMDKKLDPSKLPSDPHWFNAQHIKSIIHDLLTGLKYLKDQNYVHRDLKPANLLLTGTMLPLS